MSIARMVEDGERGGVKWVREDGGKGKVSKKRWGKMVGGEEGGGRGEVSKARLGEDGEKRGQGGYYYKDC